MNRALLTELQRLRCFPSVTVLHTTGPGPSLRASDLSTIRDLIAEADRRLRYTIDDDERRRIIDTLERLARTAAPERTTAAVALCASPEHEAVVRLGRDVRTRVVIDETFATRDMVADANRTATFRVVTISDRTARLLVGDRARLVEVQDWDWPLVRLEEDSTATWKLNVNRALDAELRELEVPTVVGGVAHRVAEILDLEVLEPVGTIPGNHDRTSPTDLHAAAWPMVDEWLGQDGSDALDRLAAARSVRRYAGGVDEVWDLARDGRVELLVVEDDFEFTAVTGEGHLTPATDLHDPRVVDDVVDELIETVLRSGGEAVMVAPGALDDHDHLAAVLGF